MDGRASAQSQKQTILEQRSYLRLNQLEIEDFLETLKIFHAREKLSDNYLSDLHFFLHENEEILSPDKLRKYCLVQAFIESRSLKEQEAIRYPRNGGLTRFPSYGVNLLNEFDKSTFRSKEYADVINSHGIDIAWALINIDFAPGGRVDLTAGSVIDENRREKISLINLLQYGEGIRRKILCPFPPLEPWVAPYRKKFPDGLDSFNIIQKLNAFSRVCKNPVNGAFTDAGIPVEILSLILENILENPITLLRSLSSDADKTMYAAERSGYEVEKTAHEEKIKSIKRNIDAAHSKLELQRADGATRDAFASAVQRLEDLEHANDLEILKAYEFVMQSGVQRAIGCFVAAVSNLYIKTGKEEIKEALIRYVAQIRVDVLQKLSPWLVAKFPKLKSLFEEAARSTRRPTAPQLIAPPQSAEAATPANKERKDARPIREQKAVTVLNAIAIFFKEARVKGFAKQDCVDALFKILDKMMHARIKGFTSWPDHIEKLVKPILAGLYDDSFRSPRPPRENEILSFLETVVERLQSTLFSSQTMQLAESHFEQKTRSKKLSEADLQSVKSYFESVLSEFQKDTPNREHVFKEKLYSAFLNFLEEHQINPDKIDSQEGQAFRAEFKKRCAMFTNQWSPTLFDASNPDKKLKEPLQEKLIDELVTLTLTFLATLDLVESVRAENG